MMSCMKNRVLIVIYTFVFLGVLFGSLLHTVFDGSVAHAACPFQEGEVTVCSMNALDHIAVWQSNFLATITPIVSVLVAAAVLLHAARIPHRIPIDALRKAILSVWLSRLRVPQTLLFAQYLQVLFARGILHPKRF